MKTIKNDVVLEYIIKKSKFITYLYYVEDEHDAKEKIKLVSKNHKDATHCCYGYIVDNVIRFSDDGEPSGTAGMPILNVLNNNNLNHVLAVVVRYFGGIKLGAGGLVRAYSNAVVEALDKSLVVSLVLGYKVNIIFTHSNIKYVDAVLKKYGLNIIKTFDNNITYSFTVSKDDFDDININLQNICTIEIEKNALIR